MTTVSAESRLFDVYGYEFTIESDAPRAGRSPGGERPLLPSTSITASDYYLKYYDELAAWAARLRERALGH